MATCRMEPPCWHWSGQASFGSASTPAEGRSNGGGSGWGCAFDAATTLGPTTLTAVPSAERVGPSATTLLAAFSSGRNSNATKHLRVLFHGHDGWRAGVNQIRIYERLSLSRFLVRSLVCVK